MGSISHITPLVINSLGGRDTHTHMCTQTHTHAYRHPHRNNFKKSGVGGAPACAWFKKFVGYLRRFYMKYSTKFFPRLQYKVTEVMRLRVRIKIKVLK